ncbi:MAG: hypothetical protein LBR19_07440 [Bifidobacteriaceae bacterium]|nr:hypothetical protein [Bifidobacteriaceae bacterium]
MSENQWDEDLAAGSEPGEPDEMAGAGGIGGFEPAAGASVGDALERAETAVQAALAQAKADLATRLTALEQAHRELERLLTDAVD